MKETKKKATYEEIVKNVEDLPSAGKCKPKDLNALANHFCKLQTLSCVSREEAEHLLDICIAKAGESDWKFLLEVFSRLFDKSIRAKNKTVPLLTNAVYKSIKEIFGSALNENDLNMAVGQNSDQAKLRVFMEELEKSVQFGKDKYFALCFMLLLLTAGRLLSCNQDAGIINIERCFFELYGTRDPKDKYHIKTIVKAMEGLHAQQNFYLFVGLYEGTSAQISQLEAEKDRLAQRIEEQNEKIASQNGEIFGLKKEIVGLKAAADEKQALILTLKEDLALRCGQNEYNENLYQKQYQSLKTEFIKKLKRDLRLELQGLEDISEALPDNTKSKIQRRLDNISKILQKEVD